MTTRITNKMIAQEIQAMTGRRHDPNFIANIRNGNRVSPSLEPLIAQALAALETRASAILPRAEVA